MSTWMNRLLDGGSYIAADLRIVTSVVMIKKYMKVLCKDIKIKTILQS